MPTLIDEMATEARRMRNAARFRPSTRERDRERRLAELLEHAVRRLEAYEAAGVGVAPGRRVAA